MDSFELTQIKVRQLFYQMKEYFSEIPDSAVRLCLQQADFDKEKAFSLLRAEAAKHANVLINKSIANDHTCFQTSANMSAIPPGTEISPVPLAPIMRQLSDDSCYSPSFDLSLPLRNNCSHELIDSGQIKYVYEQPKSTTSVNVIVKSPTDKTPRITCTQVANGFPPQVQITIHPQGMSKKNVTYPGPEQNVNKPLQTRVQAQCEKREILRRLLHESRQEVTFLSQKVDELQKELAHQQKEENDNFAQLPAYYDFKLLKQEIRDLERECQSLIRELEPIGGNKWNSLVNSPDNREWSCSFCTFLNHPELSICEQCEKPKCRKIFDVEGAVQGWILSGSGDSQV